MKNKGLLILVFLFSITVVAQKQERLDSMMKLIISLNSKPSSLKNDTLKINTLNVLGREIINTGDFEQADSLSRAALKLSEKQNFKRGISRSLNNIGIVFFYQGEYSKAMGFYEKALKIAEELGDKRSVAANLGNLGIVCDE